MSKDYVLWNNYPQLLDMIIKDAQKINVDLKRDYLFHNMEFVRTKCQQDGVVIVYTSDSKKDEPFLFFIYKYLNNEFIRI